MKPTMMRVPVIVSNDSMYNNLGVKLLIPLLCKSPVFLQGPDRTVTFLLRYIFTLIHWTLERPSDHDHVYYNWAKLQDFD